eukprot:scaffold1601_cov140-Skeletonema_marinoi.AAC.8
MRILGVYDVWLRRVGRPNCQKVTYGTPIYPPVVVRAVLKLNCHKKSRGEAYRIMRTSLNVLTLYPYEGLTRVQTGLRILTCVLEHRISYLPAMAALDAADRLTPASGSSTGPI